MPRRENFIDGIFNYCDRWCERCPFTSRCRSFAMEQKMRRRMEKKERENAEYWATMEKLFGDAIDPALKEADDLFHDVKNDSRKKTEPPDPEIEVEMEKMNRRDRFVERGHPLGRQSMQYIHEVDRFFKKDHPDAPPADAPWRDAWEVIQWYKYFIHIKFCRALHGMLDEREDRDFYDDETGEKIEFPSDSDGSAKIAIIGAERSITAWSMMREHFPKEQKKILKLMGLLAHVRTLADGTFPKARDFHRPGFDDIA